MSANEYVVINGKRYSAMAGVGATTSSGESAGLMVAESQADWRGNYPNTWYLEAVNIAGAANDDVIYTSGDVSMYNEHTIQNESGGNISVQVSVDGTNWSTDIGVWRPQNVADELLDTPLADTHLGVIKGKYKAIRILQSFVGSIAADTVYIAHSVK